MSSPRLPRLGIKISAVWSFKKRLISLLVITINSFRCLAETVFVTLNTHTGPNPLIHTFLYRIFPHKNGVFGIGKVYDIDIGDFKLLANRSCNEIVVMEVNCLVSWRSIKCRGQSAAQNILHKILLRHLYHHISFACSVQKTNIGLKGWCS